MSARERHPLLGTLGGLVAYLAGGTTARLRALSYLSAGVLIIAVVDLNHGQCCKKLTDAISGKT